MFATLCSPRCVDAIADGLETAKHSLGQDSLGDHMRRKIEACTSYAGGGVSSVSELWAVIAAANLDKGNRLSILATVEAGLDAQETAALREFGDKFCWFVMNQTTKVADAATSELGEVGVEALRVCDNVCAGDWWQWLQGVMLGNVDWEEVDTSLEYSNDDINEAGVRLLEIVTSLPEYATYKSGYERED